MMTEKLKHCPACGGTDVEVTDDGGFRVGKRHGGPTATVECMDCHAVYEVWEVAHIGRTPADFGATRRVAA